MKSDSDLSPWVIPNPGRKPPPGPERAAWLEANLLARNRTELYGLLDGISPSLRKNLPSDLDREAVALAILQFLEKVSATTARGATLIAMLRYLQRGFTAYCRYHGYPLLRIPLVQDFGLGDGLLDGQAIEASLLHQSLVTGWMQRVPALWVPDAKPACSEVIGAIVTSAALFGGLATAKKMKLLVEQLGTPIKTDGRYLWFDLQKDSWHYRWIADPATEVLIRRFTHLGLLPLPSGQRGSSSLSSEITPFLSHVTSRMPVHPKEAQQLLILASRGMLIDHFAPDVTSIALNEIENVPLPSTTWLRVLTGRLRTPENLPPLSIQPKAHQPFHGRISDSRVWKFIHCLKGAVAWNPEQRRSEGVTEPRKSSDILKDYKNNLVSEVATIRRDILKHYADKGEDGSSSYSLVLCRYAEDLVSRGGPVRESLAAATIASYFKDVSESLETLAVSDVRQLPADARQEAYTRAILAATVGNQGGVAIAVKLFERTLQIHFDIDDEVDWSEVPVVSRGKLGVDANLVDPATYQALWEALKVVVCNEEEFRPLWQSLAAILYRFGLRRGEAHELTLADIQLLKDRRIRLNVAPSLLTSLKSRQAIRRIGPVTVTTEEWTVIEAFIAQRKQESMYRRNLRDVYLFAWPGRGSQLLHTDTLFDPIKKILHWITGDETLRIHHFRHGFASRLFAAGRSPLASLDESRTRGELWLECFKQDGAWVRAFELGHLNPMESISTYCHVAELVHYHYSRHVVAERLPKQFLSALAGLSSRSVERNALRQKTGETGTDAADGVGTMLDSARRAWPLESGLPEGRLPQDIKVKRAPDMMIDMPPAPVFPVRKNIRFADALQVIRDRLCNRLDITHWEQRGIPATQIREWIHLIDKLTALGYFRANRRRRDRMPDELIECGERLLQPIGEKFVPDRRRLVARILVGFGAPSQGIQLDPASIRELQEWLGHRNPDLQVETRNGAKRMMYMKLVGKTEIAPRAEKMFMLVLAVLLLTPAIVDEFVLPYRPGSLDPDSTKHPDETDDASP